MKDNQMMLSPKQREQLFSALKDRFELAGERIGLANVHRNKFNGGMKLILLLLVLTLEMSRGQAAGTNDVLLKRGKYLVESAGACSDCHTHRDWKGTLSRTRWLQGAKLDFKPVRLMPWAEFAPAIAGLPGFGTDEQALKYFETGVNAAGKQSSPPMPQYRFNREDAMAIVAYLRSLPPPKK
jgi:mono/diheme cytochrome c family protein